MGISITEDSVNVSLFSIKISFRKFFKNNAIKVIMPDGRIIKKRRIKGLKVLFKNENSKVILNYPIPVFRKCKLIMRGGTAIFQAKTNPEKTNNSIKNLLSEVGKNSTLEIGENFCCVGLNAYVEENCKTKIGNNCLFSSNITIRNGDGHTIFDRETKDRINKSQDIEIGNNVWVGMNVIILKKAHIADHTVVGANSIVTKNFNEPYTVVAGHPAKIIKENVDWSK